MDEEDVKKKELPAETQVVPEAPEPVPEESTDAAGKIPAEPADNGVKDKIIAIISGINPDADLTNEAVFLESVLDVLTQYKSGQDRLTEAVEEFPELGDMLSGIFKGMDPNEAIARYYDVESMTPPEGAPDFEKIGTAKAERRKGVESRNARIKQLEDNQQVSVENVKKFMDSKSWSKDQAIGFLDKITGLQNDLFDGKLSEEHLVILEKGFGYDDMTTEKDKEKDQAYEDGVTAGRNQKIEKKFAGGDTGDGLPKLSNTGGMRKEKKKTFAGSFMDGVI